MEQLSFDNLDKITIKEFRNYLDKFQDEEYISLVVVDSTERKHFVAKEIQLLADMPVIIFDSCGFEDFD